MRGLPFAGWYQDPSGRFELRWWDGGAWSDRVWRQGQEYIDPRPTELADPIRAYLFDAMRRGLVSTETYVRLEEDLERAEQPVKVPVAAAAAPRAPPPPAAPAPPPQRPQVPSWQPPLPPPPQPEPVPIPTAPSAYREWWDRTRSSISADLAVHGLAYLGVLLLFAGLFGFVAFAFGDIDPMLRPFAELAIATTFFGASWFLRRRKAPFVADALEFLGGAVVPITAIASFSDSAGFPPDFEGRALVAALAITNVVLAAIYAGVSLRRPSSPLRYLAAPVLWVGVAATGLLFAGTVPTGSDLVRPLAQQWALVAAVMTATVGVARLRRSHPLAIATMAAAIPGLVIAEIMTLSTAGTSGWPVWPVIVSGLALVVGADLLADRLPRLSVVPVQTLVLVVTATALGPAWGAGWAAGALAVAAVMMAERASLADRTELDVALPVAVGGIAVLCTLFEPTAAWSIGAAAWAWAVGRRLVPLRPLPRAATAPGIWILPLVIAAGVGAQVSSGTALLIAAAAVGAVAVVVFVVRPDDGLWAAWIPTYGAALAVAAGGFATDANLSAASTTAAVAAVVLATAPRWPVARVWSAAAAAFLAGLLASQALDLSRTQVGLALGALGLVLVVAAAVVDRPVLGHIGLIGHLASLAGVAWVGFEPEPLWASGLVASLAAVGFVVTTIAQETIGSSVAQLLDRIAVAAGPPAGRGLDLVVTPSSATVPAPEPEAAPEALRRAVAGLPAALAIFSVPWALHQVVVELRDRPWDDPWLFVPSAIVLVLGGLASRLLVDRRDRLAGLLSHLGFWLLVGLSVGVATTQAEGATLTCLGLLIAHVVLVAPATRRVEMTWIAWIATFPAVALAADLVGVAVRDQYLVASGWSALLVVGGLAADDLLAGRRRTNQLVRRMECLPPVALGLVVFPVAFGVIYSRSTTVYGWGSLVAAALVAIVAWQLRLWIVSTISWLLAFVGYAALASWVPMDAPLTVVAAAAGLLVVPAAFEIWWPRDAAPRPWWTLAQLPPFLAAHVVATVAVIRAIALEDVGRPSQLIATLATTGGLGLAIGVVWWVRRGPLGAVWLAAGGGLLLAAAFVAGPGWVALALAVWAVALTASSLRLPDDPADLARVGGVACAIGSWWALGVWQVWSVETAAVRTAALAGALALGLGVLARVVRVPNRWLGEWAVLPAVGLVVSGVFLTTPDVDRTPVFAVLVGALSATAVGLGLAAGPTRQSALRDLAAVFVVLAAGALAGALELGDEPVGLVVLFLTLGVVATVAVVVTDAVRVAVPWTRPGLIVGVSASVIAAVPAVGALPRRDMLVAVLLVSGLASAVAGYTGRRAALEDVAPLLLCGAWLAYASEALRGNPQWFTAPIGLALLAVVAINRWRRRQAGLDAAAPALTAIDTLALIFIVGPSLVQIVTDSIVYGLLAVAIGVAVTVFGVLTKVRRRAAVGVGAIVSALTVMVVVPLVRLSPRAHTWQLWLGLAAAGLVAILIAAFLEQGRATARRAIAKLRELTEGWE